MTQALGCLFFLVFGFIIVVFALTQNIVRWFVNFPRQFTNAGQKDYQDDSVEENFGKDDDDNFKHFDKSKGQYVDFEEIKDSES